MIEFARSALGFSIAVWIVFQPQERACITEVGTVTCTFAPPGRVASIAGRLGKQPGTLPRPLGPLEGFQLVASVATGLKIFSSQNLAGLVPIRPCAIFVSAAMPSPR